MVMRSTWGALAAGIGLALASTFVTAQMRPLTPEEIECGTMLAQGRVPPMDYRTDRRMLQVVENAHFPPRVEQLVKPMFSHFGADLNYTLHAFPNHHRALVTMVRLGEREKTDLPKELGYTIDCFFRRAIRFTPDDVIVRMLYGQYLDKKGRRDDAIQQIRAADSYAGTEPLTQVNLGLLYLQLGEHQRALEKAHAAAGMGLDISVLQAQLQAAGRWRESTAP